MDRAHRLSSARDFRRVLTTGTRGRSAAVACAVRREPGAEPQRRPARIGIRSPRHLGTAVLRNRANRRVRAVVRSLAGSIPAGTDVVITARRPAATLGFQELEADVRAALSRAGCPC